MKKHKPMSEEEYKSLLPSEKEIEKTMNELKESFSSRNPEAAAFDPDTPGCSLPFLYADCANPALAAGCAPSWPTPDCLVT